MTGTDAGELRGELLALFGRIEEPPLTLEAGLRASATVRRSLDALQEELVRLARQEGASWASIGAALGVTTQAAHQRFGPPPTKKKTRSAPTA